MIMRKHKLNELTAIIDVSIYDGKLLKDREISLNAYYDGKLLKDKEITPNNEIHKAEFIILFFNSGDTEATQISCYLRNRNKDAKSMVNKISFALQKIA